MQHGAKDAKKMLRILVRSQYRLLVFILDIPKQGNISSGYAFSLIGISPPPGSPAGALLCCDGFFSLDLGRDASIIISSACHRSSRMRRDVKD